MNEDLIKRVKNTLKSEAYSMNEIWLRDCIEYFTSENDAVIYNEILKFVRTQWQLSDLREINNDNGCLPRNLKQQMCTVLHGTYILQMNTMYDISTSKFKQLEQIRNVSNVNIEATEDIKPQIWEPKPKRMLLLNLTDGIQDISAIEYKTISSLHDALLPGYKVMIIGPVKCRRGIILLEEGKFREIGGEVENLSITNALENVLARALNCSENPDPYNDKSQEVHNPKSPVTNDFFEDDFEVNLEEVTLIEQQSQEVDRIQNTDNTSRTINTQNNMFSTRNIKQNFVHPKDPVNKNEKNKKNDIEIIDMDDELLEMIDENQFIASTSSTSNNNGSTDREKKNLVKPFRVLPKEDNDNNIEDDIIIVKDKDDTLKCSTGQKNIKEQTDMYFPEDDFNFDDIDMLEVLEKNDSISKNKESDMKRNFQSTKSFLQNIPNSKHSPTKDKNSFETSKLKKNNINTSGISSREQVDYKIEIGNKRSAALMSPPPVGSSKIRCIKETTNKEKGVQKISDFMKTKIVKEEIPAKICDFICDIIDETIKEIMFKTVRGHFITFGKLSRKNSCWQLEGTISDKTAAIDVVVASEIIERFLGFSVKEFSQKRKLAKTNGDIEHELRMACRNAEQKLKQLDALLELELKPDHKAKVVNIRSLTNQQKELIDKRLKALKI
ncbi:recQ-mediated genome instability protein 1-like [Vespa mandarinia]|uniref:recQ-mediated genome instability protein 1-like n=1 Tax=Vespa mandarinia TaxID=7446 RepID=UPI001612EB08|nr:recQ-mediated genome instability protein 1-like [Vespa mandarinia]